MVTTDVLSYSNVNNDYIIEVLVGKCDKFLETMHSSLNVE